MKRIFTILFAVTLAATLGACSKRSAKAPVSEKPSEPIVAAAPNDKPATEPKLTEQSRRPAPDDSEIVVSSDESGNRIETRTFVDNSRISSIAVHHKADGTKEVYINGKNGEKVKIPERMVVAALSSRANDLANMVDIPMPPATTKPAVTAIPVSAPPVRPDDPAYDLQAESVSAPSAEEIQRQREAAQKAEAERLKQLQKQVSGLPPAQRRKQESGTQPED